MLIDTRYFDAFPEGWFKLPPSERTKAALRFDPVTLNSEYIGYFRRYILSDGIELCDVHMVDHGHTFRIDMTYEELRALLHKTKGAPTGAP